MHAFEQELTVKGLEQEISKITCNHQKEITELKRKHQEEILNAVEEARQKHESLEMNIRETYAKDREVAIEKERNAIRDRYSMDTHPICCLLAKPATIHSFVISMYIVVHKCMNL